MEGKSNQKMTQKSQIIQEEETHSSSCLSARVPGNTRRPSTGRDPLGVSPFPPVIVSVILGWQVSHPAPPPTLSLLSAILNTPGKPWEVGTQILRVPLPVTGDGPGQQSTKPRPSPPRQWLLFSLTFYQRAYTGRVCQRPGYIHLRHAGESGPRSRGTQPARARASEERAPGRAHRLGVKWWYYHGRFCPGRMIPCTMDIMTNKSYYVSFQLRRLWPWQRAHEPPSVWYSISMSWLLPELMRPDIAFHSRTGCAITLASRWVLPRLPGKNVHEDKVKDKWLRCSIIWVYPSPFQMWCSKIRIPKTVRGREMSFQTSKLHAKVDIMKRYMVVRPRRTYREGKS
ncbi:hypothetical protein LZ30DRAFT_300122 [Colletotrichum cereale]|nr:hypothetical protein LZ30DRAFT_300122 [Colletotrichum cereale]